jgi:DNA-binding NtrC family response regulator
MPLEESRFMELVADRFVVRDDGCAYDLASGEWAVLIASSAGGISEQARWAARCDWFARVRHRSIAQLLDYGMTGETRRFEAWRCEPAWRGTAEAAHRTIRRASEFLEACGRTAGGVSAGAVRGACGRAVILPQASTGYEAGSGAAPRAEIPLDNCGISIVDRRGVAALAEAIAHARGPRPQVLGVWGVAGAGVRTAVLELARIARTNGFVPLSAMCPSRDVRRLVRERSMFLIESSGVQGGWRRLVDWTLRSARPHLVLFASAAAPSHVESVCLGPVSYEALVGAVVPQDLSSSVRRRIERAAQQSSGVPGRFAELLFGHVGVERRMRRSVAPSVAAEQPAIYGSSVGVDRESATATGSRIWIAPHEAEALRQRMDVAVGQIERGRHVTGDRALRVTAAALARRHDWSHAARGLLALASSLLRRGRPEGARVVLRTAKAYADQSDSAATAMDVAILSGVALNDSARFDEAESVLAAAIGAAQAAREPVRLASATLALGHALFWGGRYQEAARTIASIDHSAMPAGLKVRAAIAGSRAAVGCRDLAGAVGLASEGLEAAERLGDGSLIALAACGAAFAHLSVGDPAAVERETALAIRMARTTHDPLRALRARLIAAENARRHGRHGAVPVLVRRIAKVAPTLPPTLRARCGLLVDLCAQSASVSTPVSEIVARHVAATGLKALALFGPPSRTEPTGHGAEAVEDVLDILRLCQTMEEDRQALVQMCTRLRLRLHAASVAVFAPEPVAPVLLASDGHRPESEMAARVIDCRQAIAPHRWRDGIEGGAPIQYGGETLGALVARWTIAVPPAPDRASIVLTMAATVAGPIVAAVRARRSAPSPHGPEELLGISQAMAEVRRAVERAAAAPFPVLVEGESGCGKELVARALHRRSPRRDRPFCTLNCAALPEDLVEAELFGHTRGAFTGAVAERLGVFEEAHTGTLLLDEIGELSLRAQAKILRTIQEGELRRVGENVARRVDVRIVAATNRDLRQEAAAGRFRLDLLYRLDVVRISMPPLRDRRDDIAVLADHVWREATMRVGSRATLSTATVAALSRYDWPGNVRELQNVLSALAVRSPRRCPVSPAALPPIFGTHVERATWRLDQARRTFEQQFVRAALVRTGGHRVRAAEELGLTRQGLTKLMTRLGISDGE